MQPTQVPKAWFLAYLHRENSSGARKQLYICMYVFIYMV